MSFLVKAAPIKKAKKVKKGLVIEEVDEVPDAGVRLIPKDDTLSDYINDSDSVEQKWIAILDGKIVGLVTVESPRNHGITKVGYTKFIQVIVSPKVRGKGIGEKLLLEAFAEVKDKPLFWAGYTSHSPGFKKLAEKFGIRDSDDVSRHDEYDEGWQDDGSYDASWSDDD